jgi:arylsulfatase A-like enzyme
MISMLTGQPIFRTLYELPEGRVTLHERFAEAGYRTGAVIANSALARDRGFSRGVESYAVRRAKQQRWSGELVTDRALAFFDENDGRPVFLWLQYLDTHLPYDPPHVPWQRPYPEVFEDWERAQIEDVVAGAPEEQREALLQQRPQLSHAVDRYDGALRELDRQLGRLFAGLEQQDLLDGTLVVVVSDHGETLYRRREHPERIDATRAWRAGRGQRLGLDDLVKAGHDDWVYQEQVHTPWIVAGPGIAPGRRHAALVSNLDVAPTLLGLAGLTVPDLPGRDLSAALLRGDDIPPAPFVTSSSGRAVMLRLPDGTKVITPTEAVPSDYGLHPERFDLSVDPEEREPRPANDEVAAQLLERLQAAVRTDPFRDAGGGQMDAETRERLRELGYLR